METKTIISTFMAFLISFILVIFNTSTVKSEELLVMDTTRRNAASTVYRVYLEGKSLGIVNSKEELESYIDKEQSLIKKKYNVDKVYAPNDLDIVKEYTYDEKVSTAKEIYEKIKEIKGTEAFTINGYKIMVSGVEEETESGSVMTDDVEFYVLDKEVFTKSIENAVKAFVDTNDYENYKNDSQKEIEETGKIIENLYIKNNITITETKVPTGEVIYTDVDTLSKFLIFGSNTELSPYIVKEGDTIEDVAFDNKISPEEFLIANNTFSSKNDLLYSGQKVYLGVVEPQFKVVEQDYVVSKKTIGYETKYIDDNTQYSGYEKVTQEGQNGLSLVTERQMIVNGEIIKTETISEEELKPSVEKIVVRGTKRVQSTSTYYGEITVNVNSSWRWPTNSNYTITSGYGWRWGKLHEGIDISGTGYGSPIYAVNNGLVVQSGYTRINGNYILIAHSNGYYTMYAHMSTRYKAAGATVYAGDVIGLMGASGFATGTHLHFAVYNGMPYRGGSPMNPLRTIFK